MVFIAIVCFIIKKCAQIPRQSSSDVICMGNDLQNEEKKTNSNEIITNILIKYSKIFVISNTLQRELYDGRGLLSKPSVEYEYHIYNASLNKDCPGSQTPNKSTHINRHVTFSTRIKFVFDVSLFILPEYQESCTAEFVYSGACLRVY